VHNRATVTKSVRAAFPSSVRLCSTTHIENSMLPAAQTPVCLAPHNAPRETYERTALDRRCVSSARTQHFRTPRMGCA
jgi:hypothetical protein